MAESKEDKIYESAEWKALQASVANIQSQSLRDFLSASNKACEERNKTLIIKNENITLDCSRQQITVDVIQKLIALALKANVPEKVSSMFSGKAINKTENRSVLHIALRAKRDSKILINGENQVPKVWNVLDSIKNFSNKVRNNEWKGFSGKSLKNVISIGIGGSYLGSEFVYESLRTDPKATKLSQGRTLRFYANIDPLAFQRATFNLDPEETLIIVVSKSFTTRETMMNANLCKKWLLNAYKGNEKCLTNHFIAVSANPKLPVEKFNIAKENIFEFWSWVGGRYSVTSAVGILPLSLHFSYDLMEEFLSGANNIDQHFINNMKDKELLSKNIPFILGIMGIWNSTFLNYETRGLIPYCESLSRLPAHIQQLDMESNGKRVDLNGNVVPFKTGEINFGEPGTNAQHSFFQLIHQGRVVPVDFIGFTKSQLVSNKDLDKEILKLIESNHDELMSNLFAQSDALALGKNSDEVRNELKEKYKNKEKELEYIIPHKVFPGNRPSSILLFDGPLNAYTAGQILAIYEHRTVVQGFIWGIGSFDQWGVELGKVLGKSIRNAIDNFKGNNNKDTAFDNYHPSSKQLLQFYSTQSTK